MQQIYCEKYPRLSFASVPELTRHGLGRGLHVNPQGERVLQKRGAVRKSCSGRVSALVMSAFSLSCQILVMFEAHWPMKAFPSSTCYSVRNCAFLVANATNNSVLATRISQLVASWRLVKLNVIVDFHVRRKILNNLIIKN